MSQPDDTTALTDEAFWDAYWRQLKLPVAADYARARPYEKEILAVFGRFERPRPRRSSTSEATRTTDLR